MWPVIGRKEEIMSEFTKGEWRYDKAGCVVSDAGMICDVGFMNVDPEANGHLIAAAPDLLEACKELIENEPFGVTPYFDKALRKVETAIEKATHKP